MSNRGELETAGDKRMRSIEFHKQLDDEIVIPSDELRSTLYEFIGVGFNNTSNVGANKIINTTTTLNPNWGSIRFEENGVELLLSYSPWEYAEYDNLLNGSITVEDDISTKYNPAVQSDLEETINQIKYLEPVLEEKEVASIQIPADPQIPENYAKDLSDLANSL